MCTSDTHCPVTSFLPAYALDEIDENLEFAELKMQELYYVYIHITYISHISDAVTPRISVCS